MTATYTKGYFEWGYWGYFEWGYWGYFEWGYWGYFEWGDLSVGTTYTGEIRVHNISN